MTPGKIAWYAVAWWCSKSAFPIHPPDPISPITLSGILNLESGILVLNGGEPDSSQVHVRGQVDFYEGGSISNIIGELMFNPQPESPEGQ
jgi:hypothetical protein